MQKETNFADGEFIGNDDTQRATSETDNILSDGSKGADKEPSVGSTPKTADESVDDFDQFEELIKGPYKDAFAKKVQGIINKRFKEQKSAEQRSKNAEVGPAENEGHSDKVVKDEIPLTPSTDNVTQGESDADAALKALLNAGIDAETAYKVIHLDELLDSSARYGAQMAAKNLADSLRMKAARPSENGIRTGGGFTARSGAAGLTPEKRRELAKKAMMGDKIGFN